MTEDMMKGFTKAVFEQLSDNFAGTSKTLWERFRVRFNMAFDEYLLRSYCKYSEAKTLLHKDKPRIIREFLVTPSVRQGKGMSILIDSTHNLMESNHFVLIEGTGGIGKSILMRHLFLCALEERSRIPQSRRFSKEFKYLLRSVFRKFFYPFHTTNGGFC